METPVPGNDEIETEDERALVREAPVAVKLPVPGIVEAATEEEFENGAVSLVAYVGKLLIAVPGKLGSGYLSHANTMKDGGYELTN